MDKIITLPDWVHMISLIGCDGMEKRSEWYVPIELKDLNSDYINEHFSDLQDTAYQRGFEDGKKEAESSDYIEQVKADEFSKGMLCNGQKIHDAYQRGFKDGKAQSECGCDGCKYEGRSPSPCFNCLRNASDYWTAKDVGGSFEF